MGEGIRQKKDISEGTVETGNFSSEPDKIVSFTSAHFEKGRKNPIFWVGFIIFICVVAPCTVGL